MAVGAAQTLAWRTRRLLLVFAWAQLACRAIFVDDFEDGVMAAQVALQTDAAEANVTLASVEIDATGTQEREHHMTLLQRYRNEHHSNGVATTDIGKDQMEFDVTPLAGDLGSTLDAGGTTNLSASKTANRSSSSFVEAVSDNSSLSESMSAAMSAANESRASKSVAEQLTHTSHGKATRRGDKGSNLIANVLIGIIVVLVVLQVVQLARNCGFCGSLRGGRSRGKASTDKISTELHARIQALPVNGASALKRLCTKESDGGLMESEKLVRLEVKILGPITGHVVKAPLSLKECVMHSTAVSQQVQNGRDAVPVSFHSTCLDFLVACSDDPSVEIEVKGTSVSLFGMQSGKLMHIRTFATVPNHWQDFVLRYWVEVRAGGQPPNAEQSLLAFEECFLPVGATVTIVGKLEMDDAKAQTHRWRLVPLEEVNNKVDSVGTSGEAQEEHAEDGAPSPENRARASSGTATSSMSSVDFRRKSTEDLQDMETLLKTRVIVSDDTSLHQVA